MHGISKLLQTQCNYINSLTEEPRHDQIQLSLHNLYPYGKGTILSVLA